MILKIKIWIFFFQAKNWAKRGRKTKKGLLWAKEGAKRDLVDKSGADLENIYIFLWFLWFLKCLAVGALKNHRFF